MNKFEIYDYLDNLNIWYEITEHEAAHNMAEISIVTLPYPEAIAKNLFVRDDKKRNYYLISVKGDKIVSLKEFKQKHNTRSLSFASENNLATIMSLAPGAVTPLGILNDVDCKVQLFIDKDFMNDSKLIGVHPNDNTATIWLRTEDLINLIKQHGNTLQIVEI